MREIKLIKGYSILYSIRMRLVHGGVYVKYILMPDQRSRDVYFPSDKNLNHEVLLNCIYNFPDYIVSVLEAIK